MSDALLFDFRLENLVAGAALTSAVAAGAIVDRGVRPEHFVGEKARSVMTAVCALVDEGNATDPVAVSGRLRHLGLLDAAGGEVGVDALTAEGVAIGGLPTHITQLLDLAGWRARHGAAHAAMLACDARDADALGMAETALWESGAVERRRSDWTPEQAAEDFMKVLDGQQQDVFPWPFLKLNQKSDGGVARGEITVLAGPITHGKSALLDQCLEAMHSPGVHVRLYLNEMKRQQRMARVCARRSTIELTLLQRSMRGIQRLVGADLEIARRSWKDYPIHITECSGWPVERIVRHARRSGADLIALDILNRLPAPPAGVARVSQLDDAINQLDRLAKERDMHVIVVAHLNRLRAGQTGKPPMPALTDIKDCAAVAEVADNVLFVWRKSDEAGDPTDDAMVRFGKNRTGELGGLEAVFQGAYQRFLPVEPDSMGPLAQAA